MLLVARLGQLKAALASLNPNAVLERGYSLTRNAQGEVVLDAARVKEGERLSWTPVPDGPTLDVAIADILP